MASNLTAAAGYFDKITIDGTLTGAINCGVIGLPDNAIEVDGSVSFEFNRIDRNFDSLADPDQNQFQLVSEGGREKFIGPSPYNGGLFVNFAPPDTPIQSFRDFTCPDNYSADFAEGQSFAFVVFNIQSSPRRVLVVTDSEDPDHPISKVQITSDPKKVQTSGFGWRWFTEFEFQLGCNGPHPTDNEPCFPAILLGHPSPGYTQSNSLLGLAGVYENSDHIVDAIRDYTIHWTTTFE